MTAALKDAMKSAAMAAMDIAEDVATGRVSPRQLDVLAAEECRSLFGTVTGVGDPLWALHVEVARQVLALGGVPAAELAEWVAVQRSAEGVGAEPAGAWFERVLAELDDDPDRCSVCGQSGFDCACEPVSKL